MCTKRPQKKSIHLELKKTRKGPLGRKKGGRKCKPDYPGDAGSKALYHDMNFRGFLPPSDPQEAGDTAFKAGLLTPGSSAFFGLPVPFQTVALSKTEIRHPFLTDTRIPALEKNIPGYSGGPVPDFHGIPYQASGAPRMKTVLS